MLTEERAEIILDLVDRQGSVSVQELVEKLGTSESTIRRDITALADDRKIIKARGGALSLKTKYSNTDYEMSKRRNMNVAEKRAIGKYAASLVKDGDLVYVDAGTTTEFLIESIEEGIDAVFVTNAVSHAIVLSKKGYTAYILGGRLKGVTEAIVGSGAAMALSVYNFTKGFFGTNGITRKSGLSTPDISEAALKTAALGRCKERYVLADSSKFNIISQITFGNLSDVTVITEKVPEDYKDCDIISVLKTGE